MRDINKRTKPSMIRVSKSLVPLAVVRMALAVYGLVCVFIVMSGLKIQETSTQFIVGGIMAVVHVFYVMVLPIVSMKSMTKLKDLVGTTKSREYEVSTVELPSGLGRVDG